MPHEFEIRVFQQWNDIVFVAGEKVVETKYFMPLVEQTFAKVRADKSRTTGNQNAFSHNFEFFVYCKYRHKKWIFPYLGFISAVSVTDFVDGISPKREKMVIFPEIFLTDMERYFGREQVQSIVERSKALEWAEKANKRPKRVFDMSR